MRQGLSALLAALLACPPQAAWAVGRGTSRGAAAPGQTLFAAPAGYPAGAAFTAVVDLSLPLVVPGAQPLPEVPAAPEAASLAAPAETARTRSVNAADIALLPEEYGNRSVNTVIVGAMALPASTAAREAFGEGASDPRALPAKSAVLSRGITDTVLINWQNRRADAPPPDVPVRAEAPGARAPELAAAGLPEAAPAPEVPAPASRISRALRVGALTGLAMFAVDMVALAAAQASGHSWDPSYKMPVFSDPASFSFLGQLAPVAAKVQELFIGAFLAPLNEEPYFRAGLIGLLGAGVIATLHAITWALGKLNAKLKPMAKWVNPAAFAVVAFEAAVLFTLLHEKSDPVLIGLRMAQSLLFSYLYVKEGIASTLAHHAVFNFVGLLLLPLVFATVGGLPVVLVPQALLFGALLAGAWLLVWRLTRPAARIESAEMAAGRLVAYRLSAKASLWLGRLGWLGVAALFGFAALARSMEIAFLMVAMAFQVAPAAMAFGAYGWLMRNLERRKGAAAVNELRAPKERFPLANGLGWLAATATLGAITAFVLGLVGAVSVEFLNYKDLSPRHLWLLPLPVAWLAATALRLRGGRAGLHPFIYIASAALNAAMLAVVLMPLMTAYLPWNEIEASLQEIKRLGGR